MVNKQEVLTCFCQVGVTSKEHPTATTGTKFTAHSPSFTIVHAFFSLVFEHLALVNDSPVTIIMFVLLRGVVPPSYPWLAPPGPGQRDQFQKLPQPRGRFAGSMDDGPEVVGRNHIPTYRG